MSDTNFVRDTNDSERQAYLATAHISWIEVVHSFWSGWVVKIHMSDTVLSRHFRTREDALEMYERIAGQLENFWDKRNTNGGKDD